MSNEGEFVKVPREDVAKLKACMDRIMKILKGGEKIE